MKSRTARCTEKRTAAGIVDVAPLTVPNVRHVLVHDAVFDRYNIVEEDDVKEAVRRLQRRPSGQEMGKVAKAAP